MHIEYAIHDADINDTEVKNQITSVIKYGNISTLSVLPTFLKLAKNLIGSSNIALATPIDYPFGINTTDIRLSMISNAVKCGASVVDVMIPFHAVSNRKYDKFRTDVQTLLDACKAHNIKIRYTLEYRVFTYETLYKLTQILLSFGIEEVLLSSGYRIDNIHDSILAGAMILKKTPQIKIVYNCNIWQKSHVAQLNSSNPHGIRLYSLPAVELINYC